MKWKVVEIMQRMTLRKRLHEMCRCLNYVEYLIELNHYFFVFEYPT